MIARAHAFRPTSSSASAVARKRGWYSIGRPDGEGERAARFQTRADALERPRRVREELRALVAVRAVERAGRVALVPRGGLVARVGEAKRHRDGAVTIVFVLVFVRRRCSSSAAFAPRLVLLARDAHGLELDLEADDGAAGGLGPGRGSRGGDRVGDGEGHGARAGGEVEAPIVRARVVDLDERLAPRRERGDREVVVVHAPARDHGRRAIGGGGGGGGGRRRRRRMREGDRGARARRLGGGLARDERARTGGVQDRAREPARGVAAHVRARGSRARGSGRNAGGRRAARARGDVASDG